MSKSTPTKYMRQKITSMPPFYNQTTNKEMNPQEKYTPIKLENFQYYKVGNTDNYLFYTTTTEMKFYQNS